MKSWRHLPLAPLLAHVEDRASDTFGQVCGGQAELARLIGIDRRTVQRWRSDGLTEWQADRAAFALGLHPSEVWGAVWRWVALEPEHERGGKFTGRWIPGARMHTCASDGCRCGEALTDLSPHVLALIGAGVLEERAA